MSEPVHLFNIQTVTNGSMATNITSDAVNIDEAVSYCLQATFTGAPVGSLKLEVSNDPVLLGYGDETSSISAVSGPGTYVVNVEFPAYSYVRLVYTATSGAGVLNCKINAKRR